jgi:hypothetical protein
MKNIESLLNKLYYRKMTRTESDVTESVEIAVTAENNGYIVWRRETGPKVAEPGWHPIGEMFESANDALEHAVDHHVDAVKKYFTPTDDEDEAITMMSFG